MIKIKIRFGQNSKTFGSPHSNSFIFGDKLGYDSNFYFLVKDLNLSFTNLRSGYLNQIMATFRAAGSVLKGVSLRSLHGLSSRGKCHTTFYVTIFCISCTIFISTKNLKHKPNLIVILIFYFSFERYWRNHILGIFQTLSLLSKITCQLNAEF